MKLRQMPLEFNVIKRLYIYDGNFYHIIRADAKNEVITELGGIKNIKEVLIRIGNSLN